MNRTCQTPYPFELGRPEKWESACYLYDTELLKKKKKDGFALGRQIVLILVTTDHHKLSCIYSIK